MVKRASGLTDEQRASELAACATEDDVHPATPAAWWAAAPSIATKAECLGWHRHFVGMEPPHQPAQFVGWLARDIAVAADGDGDYDHPMAHLEALDDVELARIDADIQRMETDTPLTVTIDSDGTPAVQLNGCCDVPPLLAPDEAEALADELLLGADAARQASRRGTSTRASPTRTNSSPQCSTR